MKREPNKRLIGLFILIGFTVFAAIIIRVAAEKYFTEKQDMFVMYFDESIKGLNVGSPIVFKGVEVGKVEKIDIIANVEKLEFSIPVYAQLSQNKNIYPINQADREKYMQAFIEKGLRARLVSQNFLTGQLMIELEMMPNTPAKLRHKYYDTIEIPTVLSPIGELSKGFQDMPISQTLEKFNTTLQQLNNLLKPTAQIAETLNGQSIGTMNNFNQTLQEVGDAARALRVFLDYMEQHPEALIRGKGKK